MYSVILEYCKKNYIGRAIKLQFLPNIQISYFYASQHRKSYRKSNPTMIGFSYYGFDGE